MLWREPINHLLCCCTPVKSASLYPLLVHSISRGANGGRFFLPIASRVARSGYWTRWRLWIRWTLGRVTESFRYDAFKQQSIVVRGLGWHIFPVPNTIIDSQGKGRSLRIVGGSFGARTRNAGCHLLPTLTIGFASLRYMGTRLCLFFMEHYCPLKRKLTLHLSISPHLFRLDPCRRRPCAICRTNQRTQKRCGKWLLVQVKETHLYPRRAANEVHPSRLQTRVIIV